MEDGEFSEITEKSWGICCFCQGDCNSCSQACGKCIRNPPIYSEYFYDIQEKELYLNNLEDRLKEIENILKVSPADVNTEFFKKGKELFKLSKNFLCKSLE